MPIRLQGITFLVDCYKDNIMQGNGHYDILLGNSFLDILDKYKITKEGIEILKGPNPGFLFLTRGTLPALLRI